MPTPSPAPTLRTAAVLALTGLALTGCAGPSAPTGTPSAPATTAATVRSSSATATSPASPSASAPATTAASPTTAPTSVAPPASTPRPTAAASPRSGRRDVVADHIGFATPSGNIACTMSAGEGVRCHIAQATWTGEDVPASKLDNCGPNGFGDFGPGQDVILTSKGSFGSCVSEISILEAMERGDGGRNPYGAEYRAWATGDATLVRYGGSGSPYQAYALPYGTTATAGRFTCDSAETGITCTDTSSGAGFHLSRGDLTLR